MPYEVTYTTSTRPTDLPEGAIVKEVSALPLEFEDSVHGQIISVERSVRCPDGVYVVAGGVHLNPTEIRRVRDALTEALGETAVTDNAECWDGIAEPPDDVTETKDRDGDGWIRRTGGWAMRGLPGVGLQWNRDASHYGPHTIVRRK